mmetsp:Transcript_10171/g.30572  ORF Transcript_10171/g.30572 Transcript_10171/m.30572 type:complete len:203 (-) Transcript_10171:779-1387(-)
MRKQLDVLPVLGLVKSSISFTSSTRSPAMPRTISHRLFSVNWSLVQKLTSLKQGGNLEKDLKRAFRSPALNCFRNRWSSVQNNLMSGIWNSTIASRSRPSPKAHPLLPACPASSRMDCCMTPHPSTSSHSPLKKISISKLGSVNGKYASTHLMSISLPNRWRASPSRVVFSSASINSTAPLPAASQSAGSRMRTHSIWWNTG